MGFNTSFGGWLVNFDDGAGSPTAGQTPLDVIVVLSGNVVKHLAKIGTKSNYFVQDTVPSSCTAFAFGVKTATKNYRYPENGNVQWNCATDYAADAQTCDCPNGICFGGTCAAFSVTSPPTSSASLLASAVTLVVMMVLFAMML